MERGELKDFDRKCWVVTYFDPSIPRVQVTEHQEVNKMTPMNLAIVFGPNLIWSSDEAASLTSLGEINTFTLLLIKHASEIFIK